jgi:hypothetical protein
LQDLWLACGGSFAEVWSLKLNCWDECLGFLAEGLAVFFFVFLKDDRRLAGNLNTYLFFFVKQKMAEGLRSFGD